MFGGIDLGGTKIEACLVNADLEPVVSRRIATPATSYPELVNALIEQYDWLRGRATADFGHRGVLPLGIGIPGVIDRQTGLSMTANLPADKMPLRDDLTRRLGFAVAIENDCKCFALSEATGGAGAGYSTVFGLILGTGCGGGVCHHGRLVTGRNGLPGEVGHIGFPAHHPALRALPALACGCGRIGCFETLVSGPGMRALALHLTGTERSSEEIAMGAAGGDHALGLVFNVWLDILCELVHMIQLTIDPDCIVLGGGLSRIEGVVGRLADRFDRHRLQGTVAPAFLAARFGDSSGVRGAAMLAAARWQAAR